MTRLIKILLVGLTTGYLLQVGTCSPAPLSYGGHGFSIIPNIHISSLLGQLRTLIPGT